MECPTASLATLRLAQSTGASLKQQTLCRMESKLLYHSPVFSSFILGVEESKQTEALMADCISWHGTKTAMESAENYGLVSAEAVGRQASTQTAVDRLRFRFRDLSSDDPGCSVLLYCASMICGCIGFCPARSPVWMKLAWQACDKYQESCLQPSSRPFSLLHRIRIRP